MRGFGCFTGMLSSHTKLALFSHLTSRIRKMKNVIGQVQLSFTPEGRDIPGGSLVPLSVYLCLLLFPSFLLGCRVGLEVRLTELPQSGHHTILGTESLTEPGIYPFG